MCKMVYFTTAQMPPLLPKDPRMHCRGTVKSGPSATSGPLSKQLPDTNDPILCDSQRVDLVGDDIVV